MSPPARELASCPHFLAAGVSGCCSSPVVHFVDGLGMPGFLTRFLTLPPFAGPRERTDLRYHVVGLTPDTGAQEAHSHDPLDMEENNVLLNLMVKP